MITPDKGGFWRYGKPNHKPTSYRFKTARSQNCGRVGHLKVVCKKASGESKQKRPKWVKTLQEQQEPPEQLPLNQSLTGVSQSLSKWSWILTNGAGHRGSCHTDLVKNGPRALPRQASAAVHNSPHILEHP